MPKEIELQNGMKAIVDDEDYERASKFNWLANKDKNSTTLQVKGNVGTHKQVIVLLSHYILNTNPNKVCITFKNHNRLDHRKSNLLPGDRSTVVRNKRGNRNSSSKYKGVYWDSTHKIWKVEISVNGKRFRLGSFEDEQEAALAYNEAAKTHFGESAYLNEINKENNAETLSIASGRGKRRRKKDSFNDIPEDEGKFRTYARHTKSGGAQIK